MTHLLVYNFIYMQILRELFSLQKKYCVLRMPYSVVLIITINMKTMLPDSYSYA